MISHSFASMLHRVGRRHRRLTLAALWVRALVAGWLTASLIYVASAIGWGRPSVYLVVAAFVGACVATYWHGYRPPLDPVGIARLIDTRLELKDRLATAVEWSDHPSPVVSWLLQDAEQHARFVDPAAVVTAPRPTRAEALAALIALGLTALAWTAPLPTGLLVRPGTPAPASAVAAGEDELLSRIAALRDRIAGVRTPEMRRLDRDLAALQAGLRDRALPRDEALALLQHFERRAQSSLLEQASAAEAAGDLGLERIQELAERLTLVSRLDERQTSSGGAGGRPAAISAREVSPEEIPPELLEVLRQIAARDDGPAGDQATGGQGDTPGGREPSQGSDSARADGNDSRTPGETAALQATSAPSQSSETPGTRQGQGIDESGPAGQGLPSASTGAAGEGADLPGAFPDGTGSTGSGGLDELGYESPAGARILEHVPGQLGEGPIHTGQVNASLGARSPAPGMTAPGIAAFTPATGEAAANHTLERESVPLAYREAVRNYFRSLEPGGMD